MSDLLDLMNYESQTFSVEDSPAKTSPQPARAPASTGADLDYFGSYSVSFASWSPDGWSSKTCPLFGNGAAERYSGRWPAGGTILGGAAYPRPGWEPLTSAKGGFVSDGLWMTPTVPSGGRTWPADAVMHGKTAKMPNGRKVQVQLHNQILNWPTMTASEGMRGHGYQRAKGRIYPTLTGATGAAQASPSSSAWYTPTQRDHKDTGQNVDWQKVQEKRKLAGQIKGRLNPAWVEALMNFPEGWTLPDGPPLLDDPSMTGNLLELDQDSPMTATD